MLVMAASVGLREVLLPAAARLKATAPRVLASKAQVALHTAIPQAVPTSKGPVEKAACSADPGRALADRGGAGRDSCSSCLAEDVSSLVSCVMTTVMMGRMLIRQVCTQNQNQ